MRKIKNNHQKIIYLTYTTDVEITGAANIIITAGGSKNVKNRILRVSRN